MGTVIALSICVQRMVSVYLYVPNLIGYARVVLTATSCAVCFVNHRLFLGCYLSSFVLDYFDGVAARWFNQCSKFGAILDMVTDRVSTACLLTILSSLYGAHYYMFIFLMALDIGSHWFHMVATYVGGHGHHKTVNTSMPLLIRLYYGNYPFFGFCCVSTEVFYLVLYMWQFESPLMFGGMDLWSVAAWISGTGCVVKQIVNLWQMKAATDSLVALDALVSKSAKVKR